MSNRIRHIFFFFFIVSTCFVYASKTITFGSVYIGNYAISGKQYPSSKVTKPYSVPAVDGYYFSDDDGQTFQKSITSTNASYVIIKYQPTDLTSSSKWITVQGANSTSESWNLKGTPSTKTENVGDAIVLKGAYTSGWTAEDLTYESSNPTVSIIDATGNLDTSSDFWINPASASGSSYKTRTIDTEGFRIGYFPHTEKTVAENCTVRIVDGMKTYTFYVTSADANNDGYYATEQVVYLNDCANNTCPQVGQAYGYRSLSLNAYRLSNNMTIQEDPNGNCLYNYTNSGTWSTTLNLNSANYFGSGSYIYVNSAPASNVGTDKVYRIPVIDNSTIAYHSSSNPYYFKVKITGSESKLSFPKTVIGALSASQSFTMTNFCPFGNLTVKASDNFLVSTDNSTFSSANQTLTLGSDKTFYVKFAPTKSGDITETIIMTDEATERTYPLIVTGKGYVSEGTTYCREWPKDALGNWYIMNFTDQRISDEEDEIRRTYYIYAPNEQSVGGQYCIKSSPGTWSSSDATYEYKSEVFYDNNTTALCSPQGGRSVSAYTTCATLNIPGTGDDMKISTTTDSDPEGSYNTRDKYAKFVVPLPNHCHWKTNGTITADAIQNVEVGEIAYVDVPLCNIFKSFYTSSAITIEPNSATYSAGVFYVSSPSTSSDVLVPSSAVMSPYVPLTAKGDCLAMNADGTGSIRIYFQPKAVASYTGEFSVKYGSQSAVISVSGNGIVSANEPQTIIWNQNLSQLVKDVNASVTLDAKSTSGADVSYSLTNKSSNIISLNGNVLTSTGSSSGDVTASCGATSANGISFAAANDLSKHARMWLNAQVTAPKCVLQSFSDPWENDNDYGKSSSYDIEGADAYYIYDEDNDPITYTATGSPTAFRMTFTVAAGLTGRKCRLTLYANRCSSGYEICDEVFTVSGTSDILVDFSAKLSDEDLKITNGSDIYCRMLITGGKPSTQDYNIDRFELYSSLPVSDWKPATSSTPVDFGTQRIGQGGATKKIVAGEYSGLNGNIYATITGTDADCFKIVGSNSISASCSDEGIASFDVQFIPRKIPTSGNTLTAQLVVQDPTSTSTANNGIVNLTGTVEKRKLQLDWDLNGQTKTIYTAGLAEKGTPTSITENAAFAYDKLRGETATIASTISYSVTGADVVSWSESDGKIVFQPKGTTAGTAYIKASVTGNDWFEVPSGQEPVCTVKVERGTLYFITDGKWTNASNWSQSEKIVSADQKTYDLSDYNVEIDANCFIGKDVETVSSDAKFLEHEIDAKCHSLTINNDGNAKLVIGEASTLKVTDALTNENPDRFFLTANKWGRASVCFNNTSDNPKATVEMFIPEGNGSSTDPIWHYRGICVDNFVPVTSITGSSTFVNPWPDVHIFRWDESGNNNLTSGCWVEGFSGADIATHQLQPWTGYAFANMCTEPILLSYKGTLVNANQDIALGYHYNTYTDNNGSPQPFANVGVNLITNSYTVPLKILKLGFPTAGCNKEIVLYNAGSYSQWSSAHSGGGGDAGNVRGSAGQHSTVPQSATGVTNIKIIPSGQSFFVTSKQSGKQLSISYGPDYYDIAPSGRMYIPKQDEKPEFNILTIDVTAKSDSAADRLYLIECDSCSRSFENGYDGMKRFGDTGLPQLYAYNKFGITAVNADSTINKQYIGFAAGSDDETYTISFETDRLFGYHSLYLTDRKLNQTVDILAGETYQFQGYTVGENTRFQINGITEEEWESQSEAENYDDTNTCDLRVVSNTLYIQGFTTNDYPAANIELFDMTGNLVWSTPLTDSRIYDLPSLASGIYVICLGDCNIKLSAR